MNLSRQPEPTFAIVLTFLCIGFTAATVFLLTIIKEWIEDKIGKRVE